MTGRCLVGLGLLLVLAGVPVGNAQTEFSDVVHLPDGATDAMLEDALASVNEAGTVIVPSGVYRGPLVLDRPVHLRGVGYPKLVGSGVGSVLQVHGAGSSVEGFHIEGSGTRHEQADAGIQVSAANVRITGNALRDNLFGIWVDGSPGAILANNDIEGRGDVDPGARGDAIRIFNSPETRLEGNRIVLGRDIVLWYSENSVVANNTIEAARYGIHLMYSSGTILDSNEVRGSSVGAFVMTSHQVQVLNNRMEDNRGVSGYGLAFKECDDLRAEGNVVVGNVVGLFLDHVPATVLGTADIRANSVAYNDVALDILPTQGSATIEGNDFMENLEAVTLHGEGTFSSVQWKGNFWSDYQGYDANGDGYGDIAHVERSFFESIGSGDPATQLLRGTPVAKAIDLAGQAFPLIQPRERLRDSRPAMTPLALQLSGTATTPTDWIAPASLVAVGLGLAVSPLLLRRTILRSARPPPSRGQALLEIRDLEVKLGGRAIISGLNLQGQRGECIALWGPNGSGKSTLLRAILGFHQTSGTITVSGIDTRKDPLSTRACIGYVPQDSCLPDWPAQIVLERTAALTGARANVQDLLRRVGLEKHARTHTSHMSGGQRQRLLLAMTLIANPPILLLDEPTANLDGAAQALVSEVILAAKRMGKLILIATHSNAEVQSVADRCIVLGENPQEAPRCQNGAPGIVVAKMEW